MSPKLAVMGCRGRTFVTNALVIASFVFCSLQTAMTNTMNLNDEMQLSWEINTKSGHIDIEVSVDAESWIGIGWHCYDCREPGMTNADFAIGVFDAFGKISVRDYYASPSHDGFTKPLLDTSIGGFDNIISFSGEQASGKSIMRFRKLLMTNDSIADNYILGGPIRVIFAHGEGNKLEYHGQNRGWKFINFFGEPPAISTKHNLRHLHGSLMIVSFGVCLTFGIFVARYVRKYKWWFPLHVTLQVGGVLTAMAGFAVALTMSSTHFQNWHSRFGLAVLSLAVTAPVIGLVARLTRHTARRSKLLRPDVFHGWVGRVTVLTAYVTIVLGMRLLGADETIQYTFVGAIAFLLALCLFLEIYKRKRVQKPEESSLIGAAGPH